MSEESQVNSSNGSGSGGSITTPRNVQIPNIKLLLKDNLNSKKCYRCQQLGSFQCEHSTKYRDELKEIKEVKGISIQVTSFYFENTYIILYLSIRHQILLIIICPQLICPLKSLTNSDREVVSTQIISNDLRGFLKNLEFFKIKSFTYMVFSLFSSNHFFVNIFKIFKGKFYQQPTHRMSQRNIQYSRRSTKTGQTDTSIDTDSVNASVELN